MDVTSLDLSNFDVTNCLNMSSMFEECESLETLNLGKNFNSVNVLDMSRMFKACKALQSLDLSSFRTDSVKTFEIMFADSNLLELDLSNFKTDKTMHRENGIRNHKTTTNKCRK